MQKNSFITKYYEDKLHNSLDSFFYDEVHKYYPLSKIDQPIPFFDDFFKLNFELLSYTPTELVSVLNHKSTETLHKILFSHELDFWDKRFQYIQYFKEELSNNLEFFHDAFLTLLESNVRDRNTVHYKYNLSEQDTFLLNKRDKDILIYLISIGKENNHFKNFAEKDFYTLNKNFATIIEDSNIYQKNFSFDKTLKILGEKNFSYSNKLSYFSTYHKEILSSFKKYANLVKSLDSHKVTSLFLDLLLKTESDIIHNGLEKDLVDVLLMFKEDPNTLLMIFKDKKVKNTMFIRFPELIIPFFEAAYKTNKKDILHIDLEITDFTHYRFSLIDFILSPVKNSGDMEKLFRPIPIETLDKIFTALRTEFTDANSSNYEKDKYIGNYLARYIPILIHYEKENNLTEHAQSNELIKKYFNEITSFIDLGLNSRSFSETLKTFETLLSFSPNIANYSELEENIISNLQTNIYDFFIKNKYSASYVLRDHIANITYLIEQFPHMQSILNKLHNNDEKPLWSEITFSYKTKTAKGQKTYEELPLSFSLIDNTNGALLPWFTEKNKLEAFSLNTYKEKNYIRVFSDKEWFIRSILKLSANKNSFKTLVNKTNLKFLERLTSDTNLVFNQEDKENLKTVLNYYKLDNTIKADEKQVLLQDKKKNLKI